MGGRDKRIVPVLGHARRKPRRQCLGCRVQLSQHRVAAIPPIRRIVSVLKHTMRRALAAPDRIERALTFSGVKPTCGLMILVVVQSADVISRLRAVGRHFMLKTVARCVLLGAPCCRKCSTRLLMDDTAHVWGWPVVPCPMDSPLMSFFCIVKRRLTKVTAAHVTGEAVVAGLGWVPTKNWMSRRVKGVDKVYVPPEQYSPGRSRKKNAFQKWSEITWSLGDPPYMTESMQWRMETGSGLTLPGGGIISCRLQTVVSDKSQLLPLR